MRYYDCLPHLRRGPLFIRNMAASKTALVCSVLVLCLIYHYGCKCWCHLCNELVVGPVSCTQLNSLSGVLLYLGWEKKQALAE